MLTALQMMLQRFLLCCYTLLSAVAIDAAAAAGPNNVATTVGQNVTISCLSRSKIPGTVDAKNVTFHHGNRTLTGNWMVERSVNGSKSIEQIFYGDRANPQLTTRGGRMKIMVKKNRHNWTIGIEIVVSSVLAQDAGLYTCTNLDLANKTTGVVIVMDSDPVCTLTTKVSQGFIPVSFIHVYCGVNYTGSWAPSIHCYLRNGDIITSIKADDVISAKITDNHVSYSARVHRASDGLMQGTMLECRTFFNESERPESIRTVIADNIPDYSYTWSRELEMFYDSLTTEIDSQRDEPTGKEDTTTATMATVTISTLPGIVEIIMVNHPIKEDEEPTAIGDNDVPSPFMSPNMSATTKRQNEDPLAAQAVLPLNPFNLAITCTFVGVVTLLLAGLIGMYAHYRKKTTRSASTGGLQIGSVENERNAAFDIAKFRPTSTPNFYEEIGDIGLCSGGDDSCDAKPLKTQFCNQTYEKNVRYFKPATLPKKPASTAASHNMQETQPKSTQPKGSVFSRSNCMGSYLEPCAEEKEENEGYSPLQRVAEDHSPYFSLFKNVEYCKK